MQPAGQTVTAGQTATFSVVATGTPPLSYQWRKNSANISGASECTTADGVRKQLGNQISLIVDGGTSPRDVASTIIDMSDPNKISILRQGAIPESELAEFLK